MRNSKKTVKFAKQFTKFQNQPPQPQMKHLYLLFAASIALFASSCGKATVETETKRWAATQQTLERLGGEYPGFKTVLAEAKAAGETKMKAAESVSKEEDKIKAMTEAINAARPQFVADLENMKTNVNKLKDLMAEATKKATTPEDKAAVQLVVQDADLKVFMMELQLRSAAPTNINEANGLTSALARDVKSFTERLEKMVKDGEKTAAGNKAAADSTKKVEEKKLADIKCRSCGTANPAGTKKCNSCTAPIE